MYRLIIFTLCLVLTIAAQAFERGRVMLKSGNTEHVFNVEIADSDFERARGLMYRAYLEEDSGMLFTWPKKRKLEHQKFWMHNTVLPLDILFFDKKLRLIRVDTRRPLDDTAMGPDEPTKMVLELNAGTAEKLGINPDQKWKLKVLPASAEHPDHAEAQE